MAKKKKDDALDPGVETVETIEQPLTVEERLKLILDDQVEIREKNKAENKPQDMRVAFTVGILEDAIIDVKGLDLKLKLHGY